MFNEQSSSKDQFVYLLYLFDIFAVVLRNFSKIYFQLNQNKVTKARR